MKVRNTGRHDDKIELQMTPMIDIVFQLLVFFIMTFKIVVPEGDFNIKMPLSAPESGPPSEDQLLPITVQLQANAEGDLVGLRMKDFVITEGFPELRSRLIELVGPEGGPGTVAADTEVEIDADYNLKYQYVIEAITAISGYVTPEKKIVKLIEKIKFAPPDQG